MAIEDSPVANTTSTDRQLETNVKNETEGPSKTQKSKVKKVIDMSTLRRSGRVRTTKKVSLDDSIDEWELYDELPFKKNGKSRAKVIGTDVTKDKYNLIIKYNLNKKDTAKIFGKKQKKLKGKIMSSKTDEKNINEKKHESKPTIEQSKAVAKAVAKPKSKMSTDIQRLKNKSSKINDRDLYTKDWLSTAALPVMKFSPSIGSKLVNNWKEYYGNLMLPLPYAGLVIKIMSFITKFQKYFEPFFLTLSFQDFENGLELNLSTKDVSQIKICQDKMNYLLFSFLRLLIDGKKFSTFSHFKKLSNPFRRLIPMYRKACTEWGVPRYWKYRDFNPLFTTNIDKIGLLTLEPWDRLTFLESIITHILQQCQELHDKIHFNLHDKRDIDITDDSYLVPRYLIKGTAETMKTFEDLCEQVEFHTDRKRVNMLKKKRPMKDDFKKSCDAVEEIKNTLKSVFFAKDKLSTLLSLFDKFSILFNDWTIDNPLGNPYNNDLYRLRLQEFFIGRIHNVGDFYLPKLYHSDIAEQLSIFTDLISIMKNSDKYNNDEIDLANLYETFYFNITSKFKLLFHDKSQLMKDYCDQNPSNMMENNYWFEVSCDASSLQNFIDKLNNITISLDPSNHQENDKFSGEFKELLKNDESSQTKEDIVTLSKYLSKIHKIFDKLERTIEEHGDGNRVTTKIRMHQPKKRKTYLEYEEESSADEEEENYQNMNEKDDGDYDNPIIQSDDDNDENDDISKEELKVKDDLKNYTKSSNKDSKPSTRRPRTRRSVQV